MCPLLMVNHCRWGRPQWHVPRGRNGWRRRGSRRRDGHVCGRHTIAPAALRVFPLQSLGLLCLIRTSELRGFLGFRGDVPTVELDGRGPHRLVSWLLLLASPLWFSGRGVHVNFLQSLALEGWMGVGQDSVLAMGGYSFRLVSGARTLGTCPKRVRISAQPVRATSRGHWRMTHNTIWRQYIPQRTRRGDKNVHKNRIQVSPPTLHDYLYA